MDGVTEEDFYYSPPVKVAAVAFGFPKKRSKLVQRVFDSMGWINSFGLKLLNMASYRSGDDLLEQMNKSSKIIPYFDAFQGSLTALPSPLF